MIKRKRLLLVLGGFILLVGGGAFAASNYTAAPTMTTDTVKRMDLAQTVEVTGNVQSASDVHLSFGTSGIVRAVFVEVGDTVRQGQLLATLNATALQASYAQALQAIEEAKANLALKQAGISSGEVAVSSADVDVAKAVLRAAEIDVDRVKQETADAAEQARENVLEALRALVSEVRQALANADTVLGVENPLFNQAFDEVLGAEDTNSLATAERAFEQAAESRDAAESALFALSGTDATAVADLAEVAYEDTYEALVNTSRVLDATSANTDSLSLDDLIAYKATIATAESSLVSVGSALRTARQTSADADRAMVLDVADAESVVASREADVARAEASLDSAVEAPREVDVASLQAAILQAEASASAAAARLRDAQIVTPIAGIVSAVSVDPGESASALSEVITVVALEGFAEITLNLPEADVAKTVVGQTATATFDAFGDDQIFTAVLASIDPAQTVIQDVVFYQAKVILDASEDVSAVKPGMSATVTINTATRQGVLAVPSRAVLEKDGVKYVRVPDGESYRSQNVTIGLRADNGLVEVLTGLSEGDTVITALR